MRHPLILTLLALLCFALECRSEEISAHDSISLPHPEQPDSDFWITRIRKRDFDIKDTTIHYPRFLQFCVNAYNWGDRTFNTYNPHYVEGTGKKWKVMFKNDNWTDSYAMDFTDHMPIRMLSNVYSNVGVYLAFMAVSVGYSVNCGNFFASHPVKQKKFEFSFNCSLFTVDAYYSRNDGGTYIRRFGDYDEGKWINHPFSDLRLESYGVDAYYFLNHYKYSQGAVYNFSKFQRRSAGSFIFGVTLSHQDVKMNFATLPTEMQAQLPDVERRYDFLYNDFCIMGGYGYNWVFHPKWVFNITALPSMGVKHSFAESIDGSHNLFSMNIKGRTGITYNLRNFFLGIFAKTDGHWYLNHEYSFFNAITTFGATAGLRF